MQKRLRKFLGLKDGEKIPKTEAAWVLMVGFLALFFIAAGVLMALMVLFYLFIERNTAMIILTFLALGIWGLIELIAWIINKGLSDE